MKNYLSTEIFTNNNNLTFTPSIICLLCPRPRREGGGIRRSSASVCLMSHTSALTRKPKGLGRRNFAQGYPRSHETPTPTSRSKGPKSRWGGGILWRRPSRTACSLWPSPVWYDCHGNACMHIIYYGHQAHETNINQRANRAGDSLIHTHCSGGII